MSVSSPVRGIRRHGTGSASASIAATGSRTTGPWPTTITVGSSARTVWAELSSVSPFHVAIDASGNGSRLRSEVATTPDRRERVAGDHRAVARVEERHVPRRVARGRDDLEAADAVTGVQAPVRGRPHGRPAARQLAFDHRLARQDARVELGDQHLDVGAEALAQRVERPGVIAVTVGQGDAPDWRAGVARRLDQRVRSAAEGRVDEREPVVLAHEERVDEVQAGQLGEVLGDDGGLHVGLSFEFLSRLGEYLRALGSQVRVTRWRRARPCPQA